MTESDAPAGFRPALAVWVAGWVVATLAALFGGFALVGVASVGLGAFFAARAMGHDTPAAVFRGAVWATLVLAAVMYFVLPPPPVTARVGEVNAVVLTRGSQLPPRSAPHSILWWFVIVSIGAGALTTVLRAVGMTAAPRWLRVPGVIAAWGALAVAGALGGVLTLYILGSMTHLVPHELNHAAAFAAMVASGSVAGAISGLGLLLDRPAPVS